MAEAYQKGASDEYLLVYAQLLGNLADSWRFEDLEQAVQLGRRAHGVLRKLTPEDRADDLYTELGWVTARLLISEYRYARQDPARSSLVEYTIGALWQTESGLKHFEAMQLAPWEVDVINAIVHAFRPELCQKAGATRILMNYKAKQLGDVEIRVLCEELADLPAFRNSPAFQEFLDLQPTQL